MDLILVQNANNSLPCHYFSHTTAKSCFFCGILQDSFAWHRDIKNAWKVFISGASAQRKKVVRKLTFE